MNAILTSQFIFRFIMMMASIIASAFNRLFSLFLIPITLNLYAIISAFSIIIILASITMSAKAAIAALGIALMSLPFRIGRNAGASLLAFSLVANAMLPYLPSWMSFFYQGLIQGYTESYTLSQIPAYELYNAWGIIHGVSSTYPHGGLILFNNTILKTTFIYKVRRDGGYYIIPPNSIPNGTYKIYFEYLGAKLIYPNLVNVPNSLKLTYEIDEAPYRLDIRFNNAAFLSPDILFYTNDCSNIKVVQDKTTSSTIECIPATNYVHVTIFSTDRCIINVKARGGDIYSKGILYSHWRGIGVREYILGIYGGIGYPITLTLDKNGQCSVEWNEIVSGRIVHKQSSDESLAFGELIYSIIYITALPIAVFSFLTLMSLTIVAVARTLGASYSRVVFEW